LLARNPSTVIPGHAAGTNPESISSIKGTTMWMIRGPRGRDAQQLLERGVIGLGWGHAAPRPQDAGTPREFYAAVRKSCPQLGHDL
jgi:hypothetical protein